MTYTCEAMTGHFYDATTMSLALRNVYNVGKKVRRKKDLVFSLLSGGGLNRPVYCSRTKISRAFASGGERREDENNNNNNNMKRRKKQRRS